MIMKRSIFLYISLLSIEMSLIFFQLSVLKLYFLPSSIYIDLKTKDPIK